jgi:hypothetical protein
VGLVKYLGSGRRICRSHRGVYVEGAAISRPDEREKAPLLGRRAGLREASQRRALRCRTAKILILFFPNLWFY